MKKSVIIILLSFLSTLCINAQKLSEDFTVNLSKPFDVVDAVNKKYFSIENGKAISVKTTARMEVFIQKFDAGQMQEIKRNTYDDFPKRSSRQDVVQVGKKIYYFTMYTKENKRFSNCMHAK